MSKDIIKLQNIHIEFDDETIIEDLNLNIKDKEFKVFFDKDNFKLHIENDYRRDVEEYFYDKKIVTRYGCRNCEYYSRSERGNNDGRNGTLR